MSWLWIIIKGFLPATPVLIGYGVAAAVALGVFSWWSVHQYNKGWAAAIYAIATKDAGAVKDADKIGKAVDDCFNSSRVWDNTRGVCL